MRNRNVAPCGAVRPGTLGYQRCWKEGPHDEHKSNDMGTWPVERRPSWRRSTNVVPFAIETMPAYALQQVTERAGIMLGDACTVRAIWTAPQNEYWEGSALYRYAWHLLAECTREATSRLEASGDPR